MKYLSRRIYLQAFLLVILALSGCSGIKLTVSEQVMIQEALDNVMLLEDYLNALQLMEAEESHADDMAALTEDVYEASALLPSQLRGYPEGLPARVTIEEEQKVEILTKAYPLSQQALEQASALFDRLAVPKLAQAASNLAIIWSVESSGIERYRQSHSYAEAHNALLSARRHYPQILLEPSIQFGEQFVEFDDEAKQLRAKTEDDALPDVLTTAEYIERSNKICEKILFHYLTKRGDLLVATGQDVIISDDDDPAKQGKVSVGGRILMALDETFGALDVMPALLEQHFSVSFQSGGYTLSHLSREDRAALQTRIEQVIAAVQTYDAGRTLVVSITTLGYTDETPLRENKRFVQNFIKSLKDAGEQLPQKQPARKQALNAHFSRLRALIINEHIQQQLQQAFGDREHLNIVSEIIGKGEELPEGLSKTSSAEDRRLCEVTIVMQSGGGY